MDRQREYLRQFGILLSVVLLYPLTIFADGLELVDVDLNGEYELPESASPISQPAVISMEGRYIAFCSGKDLVPEDNDEDYYSYDLYVKDMETGELLYFDFPDGSTCLGSPPQMSADGNILVFSASGVLNHSYTPDGPEADHFVYERDTDTLINLPGEYLFPVLTADGKTLIVKDSDGYTFRFIDIDSMTERETCSANHNPEFHPDGSSSLRKINPSFDGSRLAFVAGHSIYPDYPESDVSSTIHQVYLLDCADDELHLVTVNPFTGEPSNATPRDVTISGDGNTVLVTTTATNLEAEEVLELPHVYHYEAIDRELSRFVPYGDYVRNSWMAVRLLRDPAISYDGSRIAYAFMGNPVMGNLGVTYWDVMRSAVWDSLTGKTSLLDVNVDGIVERMDFSLGISGGGEHALHRGGWASRIIRSNVPTEKDMEIDVRPVIFNKGIPGERDFAEAEITIRNLTNDVARYMWLVFSQPEVRGVIYPTSETLNCRYITNPDVADDFHFGKGVARLSCVIHLIEALDQVTIKFTAESGAETFPHDTEVELVTNAYDPDTSNNQAAWKMDDVSAPGGDDESGGDSNPGNTSESGSGGGAVVYLILILLLARRFYHWT